MFKKKSEYYQIITSLPLLQGRLCSTCFIHMSRIGFDKHLSKINPKDLQMVQDLETFVIWEKHSMDSASDEEFKKRSIELQKKYKNETFLKIINLTIKKRLLLGLLRKRKNGLKESPPLEEIWALSDDEYSIKNNWNQTDLGLKNLGGTIINFDKLLQDDESLLIEKNLLQLIWNYCDKISVGHYFDIDFILIYAIRRNIIERWAIVNMPQEITEKFNILADEAMKKDNYEENGEQ